MNQQRTNEKGWEAFERNFDLMGFVGMLGISLENQPDGGYFALLL
jgi:hypothetical protein